MTPSPPTYAPTGYCRCGYRTDPGVCPECGRTNRRMRRWNPRGAKSRTVRIAVVALLACTALVSIAAAARFWVYRSAPMDWVWWLDRQKWLPLPGFGQRVFNFRRERFHAKAEQLCWDIEAATTNRDAIPWWAGQWGNELWLGPDRRAVYRLDFVHGIDYGIGEIRSADADGLTASFFSLLSSHEDMQLVRIRIGDQNGLTAGGLIEDVRCLRCILRHAVFLGDSETVWKHRQDRSLAALAELPYPHCEYLARPSLSGKMRDVDYEYILPPRYPGGAEMRIWGGWIDAGAKDGFSPGLRLERGLAADVYASVVWTEQTRSYIQASQSADAQTANDETQLSEPIEVVWYHNHVCRN